MKMVIEHVDVLVVGAGLSGIGAGGHLKQHCPERRFAILEGREAMGGTWDLFRYPGIRSDSDMHTLGYAFKPWTDAKTIADGDSILNYIRETAREHQLDQHIRYGHKVMAASWSSQDARWTVDVERGPHRERIQLTCQFLFLCSGYYNYERGYTPQLPGLDQFKGRVVHPQQWTPDVDYTGKRVVVIGSGATAVTLVPVMADKAAHVTMLQRSPTYVVSRPAQDKLANTLKRLLPRRLAYGLTRWKNVLLGMLFFQLSRSLPEMIKSMLLKHVQKALGQDFDVGTHFTPSYKPWDQRMCLVPDADLFKAIKSGRASVVTDRIEGFTESGIKLKSGQTLEADLVVTATGLDLLAMGGVAITVDGRAIVLKHTMSYKSMMLAEVPNLAYVIGYTNASWTLKGDLTCQYVCRLLNHMARQGVNQCMPHLADPSVKVQDWLDFSPGYILRALNKFPRQGTKAPWRLHQNYALDLMSLRFGSLDDGTMVFSGKRAQPPSDAS
jgi:monooxygenase